MYSAKLPATGVSFLMLGIPSFYNLTLSMLLIITLSIVLFRFIRLLLKEGTLRKIVMIICMLLLVISLIVYLGKIEADTRIKKSEVLLNNYKKTIDNTLDHNMLDESISSSIETNFNENMSMENMQLDNSNDYPHSGEILGLIRIERISLELPIIEGTKDENLWLGAAHVKETPFYWEQGNSFLASHNAKKYGKLFNRLNELKIGDKIMISTADDSFAYVVYAIETVQPDDTECFNKIKGQYNLSLVTCINSGRERIIVYCQRIKS